MSTTPETPPTSPYTDGLPPILTIEPEVYERGKIERFLDALPILLSSAIIIWGIITISLADTMVDIASGLGMIIVGVGFTIVDALRDIRALLSKAKEVYWNEDMALMTLRTRIELVPAEEEPLPRDPDAQSIDVGAGGDWAGVPTPHKDEVGPPVTAEDINAAAEDADEKDFYEGGENPPLPPKGDDEIKV